MSLAELPPKDWGSSLLFLLDLCINRTLCKHNIAIPEGYSHEIVTDKAASKGLPAQHSQVTRMFSWNWHRLVGAAGYRQFRRS